MKKTNQKRKVHIILSVINICFKDKVLPFLLGGNGNILSAGVRACTSEREAVCERGWVAVSGDGGVSKSVNWACCV